MGAAETGDTTVPKNQPTAAKRARAIQHQAGGKHTALLAAQTCGQGLDPYGEYEGTCARAPHTPWEPHSEDRNFDIAAWEEQANSDQAAEEARRAALSDDERAEEDRLAFEEAYDDGRTASDEWEYARSYKWED